MLAVMRAGAARVASAAEIDQAIASVATLRVAGWTNEQIFEAFSVVDAERDREYEREAFRETGLTIAAWHVRQQMMRLVTH